MKTIIAGSRGITDYELIHDLIHFSYHDDITEIVSGHARGVDKLGEQYAKDYNLPTILFKPDWKKHGRYAGYKRNIDMVEYADMLIAVWDGKSKGTRQCISAAKKRRLPTYVFIIKENIVQCQEFNTMELF